MEMEGTDVHVYLDWINDHWMPPTLLRNGLDSCLCARGLHCAQLHYAYVV